MKFSIITVTFNSANTLASCISSINSQTYPDIEHIIIDGASTDNTLAILKNTPNRITKIVSEPDKGIYDAMNKGFNYATGDIIGILNSDDFLASNDILEIIAKIFEQTKCDAVFGNLDFVAATDPNRIIRKWKSSPYEKDSFKKGWHIPHPTFYVKSEIYKKHGTFDISLDVSADFELMLRFIEKHKIKTHYLNKTIVKMRYGGISTTSFKGILLGNKNVLRAFKKNQIKVSPLYTIHRIINKFKQFLKK